MFFPQAMTDIQLIVPARDMMAVTNVLAGQGVFHQVDASYLSSKANLTLHESWQDKAAEYAVLERRILFVMKSLGVEEGSPENIEKTSMIEIDMALPQVEHLEREVNAASKKLAGEQEKLEQLQTTLQQIEPLAGIDFDMSALRNPQHIFSMLGIIPSANMDRLQTSLARIPFVFLTLRLNRQKAVVWLAGLQNNSDILERAARSAYLNPVSLPADYQGTPSEIIQSLQGDIERTSQRIAKQKEMVTLLHEAHKQQLDSLLWRVRGSRMLVEAVAHFGRLQYTYLIVGWVPTSKVAGLTARLKQVSNEILIESFSRKRGTGNSGENIPVALKNPKLLNPFQALVVTFSQPRYEELDPTFIIAVTFPLLFGAMFGDVGHGLLLALLGGLLVSRKVPALRGLAGLGGLVIACGLVATLFGFLYGSIFGMENILPALWLHPMDNIMEILLITIGAGVVLLSIGFIIGILNAWVVHDWGRLLFDRNGIAGLVLYWSLLGLVASFFIKGIPISSMLFLSIAILSGLTVMLSEALKNLLQGIRPLIEESLFAYAIQVFFELFETVVSFLSNSLSYVRVGAFAVAHVGLSAVFFILAELVSPVHGPGYWIVIILGTVFIVGFEGLIVGIQSMRLEYYEFFSKFYMGGGIQYKPLTIVPPVED
jgi:V/A-type H+-transporting ATPase subunit I